MRLYERDLRQERPEYTPHLASSFKTAIIGFYILMCIGLTTLGAYSIQYWKSKNQANLIQRDLQSAKNQLEMLESVTKNLEKRRELVTDIQAWLRQRFDLEAVYHQCVGLAHRDLLLQSFSVSHEPARSTLIFVIEVEGGESSSYNRYFRALTTYFTNVPGTKVADIQITPKPAGALLSIEVLTEDSGGQLTQVESF